MDPFWQDWRFWEIGVTAISALLGFLGGTLVHHGLERRRERLHDREEACVLAAALHAEVSTMRSKAMQLLGLLGQSSGVPIGGYEIGRAIGIPKSIVFERNVRRLGMLPADLARNLAPASALSNRLSLVPRCKEIEIESSVGWGRGGVAGLLSATLFNPPASG